MYKVCILGNPEWPHVQKWACYFIAHPDYEVHIISSVQPRFTGALWHNLGRYTGFPLPWTLNNYLSYRKILRQINPDIVHIHNVESSFFPATLAWHGPLVVTAYGLDVTLGGSKEPPAIRKRKIHILRRADVITAASLFLLDVAISYGMVDSGKGVVTPFGVDICQFKADSSAELKAGSVLGFFKDLKPEYGPLQFLEALRIVRDRCGDVRAIMVGDGPLRGEVERILAGSDLAGVVDLYGKLPHGHMPEMYRRIDVCVMPSIHESFGVVALESQAMGVPVVATRVEGLPEVIRDGVTGLLLDSNEPHVVADAVVRLLGDAELRRTMGAAGRAFVTDSFSLESNGRVMEEVYRRVMHA